MTEYYLSHIIKIIVFPTRTNALLSVRCSLELGLFALRVHLSQKDRLELIHSWCQ